MALRTQRQWKHHVFLSFRGEDTRRGFISHLYHALHEVGGIRTFKDDQDLERGTAISPELVGAIKQSQLAVVVLSPNYASSTWCLDELTEILQCMEARNAILPIFYDVEPSDVRNQRGSFAEAFTKHEEKFRQEPDKVKKWRDALTKVANISGWDSNKNKTDHALIEDIVNCVWKHVSHTLMLDPSEKLVGIDFKLKQLDLLLAPEENDVRFIGIWGMGGVGKTTIAKSVFDKISHTFKASCFLADVSKYSSPNALVDLQKQLLSQILKKRSPNVWDEGSGRDMINNFLANKKVLLILDDVDQLSQKFVEEILVGNKDLFGVGSRIIITTRDQRVLVELGIETERTYEVQVLCDDEALELFRHHAFREEQYEEGFLELFKCFLKYAKGLPLAVKILGKALYKRSLEEWKCELDKLDKILKPSIFDSLKISYDGLDRMEQMILLDVACFYNGKEKEELIRIIDRSGDVNCCRIGIQVLIEKSLITIQELHYPFYITMHDLVQQMALEIVRRESEKPGARSRLWLPDDISHVFMTNTGTEAIEGIVLRFPNPEEVPWNCEGLSKMPGLKFLDFENVIISSEPKFLPNSLRIIHWNWYPSKFLPPNYHPYCLTQLRMCHSKLVRLWDGRKNFPNLKCMDLSNSDKLTTTPDLTGLPNLEELNLACCTNLAEMHPFFAGLKRLKRLDLSDCKSIRSLPNKVEMDSLERFDLSGCPNVKRIPEFSEPMKNLSLLSLSETAIEKLPSSIEHLVGLTELRLRKCKNLLDLPIEIYSLESLRYLNAEGCSKLYKLPGEMECLDELDLAETAMREPLVLMKKLGRLLLKRTRAKSRDGWGVGVLRLVGRKIYEPDPLKKGMGSVLSSLNRLCCLQELDLSHCDLCEGDIPDDIGCLSSLQYLFLSGNNFESLPESIGCLSELFSLYLDGCKRLQQLSALPSNGELHVNVNNCTSLKWLSDSDTSKLSRFAKSDGFNVSAINCFRLVEDEGWINCILPKTITAMIKYDSWVMKQNLWPGSEIPEWFSNRSEGHSLHVELPPQSCTNWLGIAFCVVFTDPRDPAGRPYDDPFTIDCSHSNSDFICEYLESEHVWVFYIPRNSIKTPWERNVFFRTHYFWRAKVQNIGLNTVKKCGARLVYEQDLEELIQTQKILKRTHEYSQGAGPSGSDRFGDYEQALPKRLKGED